MWLDHLPASVAFCDVETTGLGNHDRIVSFGGIGMISRNLAKGRAIWNIVYLVFDPGTENRRGAEQIHGFSDSTLRLQDPFAVHAAEVRRFLTSYELLVAHNAAFDLRFINREMRLAGLPALTRPVYCTMKGYRALEPRRQRFSERGLPPHQARSCWRSARRDRGRLARDADLSLAARLPASASIARLASSHSIQLASPAIGAYLTSDRNAAAGHRKGSQDKSRPVSGRGDALNVVRQTCSARSAAGSKIGSP